MPCAVWLDRLSVPQDNSHASIKQTLLTRMMGVYASAAATLALHSNETDGSRLALSSTLLMLLKTPSIQIIHPNMIKENAQQQQSF
eukprot:scaffold56536_cov17-Prasinocladus_malaysianus.AAC.1